MRVISQTIRVTKTFDEVHSIQVGTKFKSLLKTPGITGEAVLDFMKRYMGSRYIDENSSLPVLQETVSTPIVRISINFQFSDGTARVVNIWDSIDGFHQEEYDEAKKYGMQVDKIIERNNYVEQYS